HACAVASRQRSAAHLVGRQLAVARALGEIRERRLDLREALAVAVADHGYDEPRWRRDGHPGVVLVLEHDLFAVDLAVHLGHVAQRRDHGLREERGEAEPHAVLLLEGVLVARARLCVSCRGVTVRARPPPSPPLCRSLGPWWGSRRSIAPRRGARRSCAA